MSFIRKCMVMVRSFITMYSTAQPYRLQKTSNQLKWQDRFVLTYIYFQIRSTCLTNGEDYIASSFMLWTPHKTLFRWSNQEKWDRQGMWHVWRQERSVRGFGGETWEKQTIKLIKGEFSQKHNLFRTDGIFCNWNYMFRPLLAIFRCLQYWRGVYKCHTLNK